ncbi:hypothetical protein ES703_67330 [subsurface metagenome]
MIYLNIEVFSIIAVAQVGADTSALCHPIHPDAPDCVVDIVVADQSVNGSMQLDAGLFRATEWLVYVNVVDVVSSHLTESTTHAAANSGRPTIVDRIVSDEMRTDSSFRPPSCQGAFDGLDISFGTVG